MSGRVEVQVRSSARRFEAEAELELAADAGLVWQTITDYAALPRFMPGIRSCRVLQRKPAPGGGAEKSAEVGAGAVARGMVEHLMVEQRGEFRFLLFAQTMDVLLHIEHQGQQMAQAKAVRCTMGWLGSKALDQFEGRYELTTLKPARGAARTRLRYSALIGLLLPAPPAVGSLAVRQNLAAQLQAVAAEVARRTRAA